MFRLLVDKEHGAVFKLQYALRNLNHFTEKNLDVKRHRKVVANLYQGSFARAKAFKRQSHRGCLRQGGDMGTQTKTHRSR